MTVRYAITSPSPIQTDVPMLKLSIAAAIPLVCLPFVPSGRPASVSTAAETYSVDPVHSSVVFKVKHADTSWFYGVFEGPSGKLQVDAADPTKSSIEIEIDAATVDSRDDKRDAHIQSPDFLSAKEFPAITFQSTAVRKKGEKELEVTGDLTFRGVTKSITVPVTLVGKGEFHGKRIGYETTFTIKRSDFGSSYGVADKALGDEVTLIIGLEGVIAP
jgi:polyisoprenoid-binding protein YceI